MGFMAGPRLRKYLDPHVPDPPVQGPEPGPLQLFCCTAGWCLAGCGPAACGPAAFLKQGTADAACWLLACRDV